MALMPWDYEPSIRAAFGIPQQNQVDRGYGLTYDTTGWEVDPTSGADRSTMRKKATPEDLATLQALANSFIDPNQGGEGNNDPWAVLYDMTGIEYDPNTGYIYSSKGPTPGTGGGPIQSVLSTAAPFLAAYTLGSGYGALAGEPAAAGTAAGTGTATGSGATGATSSGLGLDASLSSAAGGDATLAGTSGAGAFGGAGGAGSGVGLDPYAYTPPETPLPVETPPPSTPPPGDGGYLASINKALGTSITGGDIAKFALVAAPAVAGAFASNGGTPVSATSTTTNLPAYMQAGAQQTWDDFINSFYGLSGGKSFKQMLDEDTTFKQTQGNKLSTLLQSLVDQGTSGTGMFTPTNVSFGGNKVFDFVPKSNRNLANQLAALQGANYDLSDDLAPNASNTAYLDKLFSVITALQPQGNTSNTQTTTTPTTSTWANILQGLTQGVNLYNALDSGSSSNVKMVKNADGTYSLAKV